ncbi:GNAT family N-acetyltransferase [Roseicyclus sp. F158]|uniref:GNAT family N-acetyltransferase n=1 Tax=Tropicimonas omnivorans TaxID=3075590 RepID=A0ABU3DFW9_9RHOB|nr:GNAT family N-acetyltransferase [Roseicyclus sp. F158]MDT0682606.1 GNAT family N-acetyltransferase [Roseicyclus sp. F158]
MSDDITFREAVRDEVPAIVALLRDDHMGKLREGSGMEAYLAAFDAMSKEGTNRQFVGVINGEVVACYQLTVISGLSLSASRRAQIEAVRVATHLRGQGHGARLVADAEARAREAGARLLQFTSNAERKDAHRFYQRLGYAASHTGFKKSLD